jgi:chromosome partitioning protein
MSETLKILSTVSGKGGVGKTIISANFARIAAFSKKVLLIDFDFPNQGLTGLFAEYLNTSCFNARDMILDSRPIEFSRITTLRQNLFFVPAFDPADQNRYQLDFSKLLSKEELIGRLNMRLNTLINDLKMDLIILDCHGGLDSISFASFMSSDCTLLISEPDKITFNGTLELTDYYEENLSIFASLNKNLINNPQQTRLSSSREALLILNRVSGRFS